MTEPRFEHVQGLCPSCRSETLFLAVGGHVTCARLDCENPGAVDDLLHDSAAVRIALAVMTRSA